MQTQAVSDAQQLQRTTQCVANRGRRTRGFIKQNCITEARAREQNAVYKTGDCKGTEKTYQAEAVEQARAIAHYAVQRSPGEGGTVANLIPLTGISPDIQWETTIPYSKPNSSQTRGRADILIYDHTSTTSDLGIIEVKAAWNGGVDDANDQIGYYTPPASQGRMLDGHLVVAYSDSTYRDQFEIAKCEPGADDPGIWAYTTTQPAPGTLILTRVRKKCDGSDDTGYQENHEHHGIHVTVGVDANGNGNDDFWDGIREIAVEKGWTYYLQAIPDDLLIPYRSVVHLILTSHQVRLVLEGLVAMSSVVPPAVAARRVLETIRDAEEGSSADLAADAPLTAEELASIEASWNSPTVPGSDTIRVLDDIQGGIPSSESNLAGAADDLATDLSPLASGEGHAELAQSVADTLVAVEEGGSPEVEAAEADVAPEVAEALVDLLEAGTVEEVAAGIGFAMTGAVVLVLVAAVAVGVIWAADHWNLFGDPHLVTLDGLTYDMQSVGEFHLLKIPSQGVDIQGRFTALNSDVSALQAISMNVNETLIEIHSDGSAYVNGDPLPADTHSVDLGDGAALLKEGDQYVVRYPGDDGVTVSYGASNFAAQLPDGITTAGLLGDHNGAANDDLRLADGSPLPSSSPTEIDGQFADSWRIDDDESDFSYDPGQSTATFTDMTFPAHVTTIDDFPAADIEDATLTCRNHEVAIGPALNDCVYDVLVTGDDRYADAAAAVSDQLIDPSAKTFDSQGQLHEDFTSPVASNFASHRYLTDPATSRVAGPIFDSSGYSFYELDTPRHDSVTMDLRLVAYGPIDTDTVAQSVDVAIDDQTPISVPLESPDPAYTGPGSLTYVSSGTTTTGTPFSTYDLAIPISHFGAAMKVQLDPHGFRGVLDTALGVNSIDLSLTTTPADTFDAAFPVHVSPDQPFAGAGRLETPGAEDDYRFSLPDTEDLLLDVNGCVPATVRLVSGGSGQAVPANRTGCGDRVYRAVPAGNYVLSVATPGQPITYSLDLSTAPAAQSFNYQVGQHVSDGTIGNTAAAGAGSIETVASEDIYTFTQPRAGEVMFVGSGGACAASQLLDADGVAQGSVCGTNVFNLQPGTYRIDVPSADHPATGAYSFDSYLAYDHDPPPVGVAVDGGAAYATTINGQHRTYTFNATAGRRLVVSMPSSTINYWDQKVQILAPDGSEVANTQAEAGSHWYIENAQAGTYQVIVSPLPNKTGIDYLAVKDISDKQLAPAVDGSDTSVTLDPDQNADYSINAIPGQRFSVWIAYSSINYWDQTVRVYAPDGTLVYNTQAGEGSHWYIQATQAGVYTVVLDPTGEHSGTVTMRVKDISDQALDAPTDGSDVNLNLAPGQDGQVGFTATAGQRISVWMTATTINYWDQTVRIYAPDGTLVSNTQAATGSHWYVESTQPGLYTVVLDPAGDHSGSATMRVKDISDKQVTPLVDGSDTNVVLDPDQNAQFSVHATAGQRFAVSMAYSSINYWDQTVRIYAPDGTLVSNTQAATGSRWYIEPSQAGVYTVVLDPAGDSSGSATMRVKDISDKQLTPLVDGSDTNVALDPDQNAQFSFNATAGQRFAVSMAYSAINYWDQTVRIYAPDGTLVSNTQAATGSHWYVDATQDGVYKFVLDPSGEASGAATMRVKDISDIQVTAPIDGTDSTVVLAPSQRAQLGFTATQGQRFLISMTADDMYYWSQEVRIVAPDGTVVADGPAGPGSHWYVENAQAGVYKVLLIPGTDISGSATMRVKDISDIQVTAPIDGTDSTVVLAPSQRAQLGFTATEGQRFLITMADDNIYYWSQEVKIVAPDGTVVADTQAAPGSHWYIENAQAGTYKVLLIPGTDISGTDTLRVKDISDIQVAAPIDGTDTTVVMAASQHGYATLTADSGQHAQITIKDQQGGPVTWRLLDPQQQVIQTGTGNGQWAGSLPADGQYTLKFDASNTADTTFTLSLRATPTGPPSAPAGSYAAAVIQDSPSAWYRLADTDGSTLVDSSGHGRDGNWSTPPAASTSLLTTDDNGATGLDGSSTYARVNNEPWLDTSSITVEAWVQADTTPSGSGSIIASRENWSYGYGDRYAWTLMQTGGHFYWRQFDNGGSTPTTLAAPAALTPGQTYYVAVTYDGTTATMYVDGEEVASVNLSGTLTGGPTDLTIGRPDYPAGYWDGDLDDIAIYPTALSPSRISAHYAAGATS